MQKHSYHLRRAANKIWFVKIIVKINGCSFSHASLTVCISHVCVLTFRWTGILMWCHCNRILWWLCMWLLKESCTWCTTESHEFISVDWQQLERRLLLVVLRVNCSERQRHAYRLTGKHATVPVNCDTVNTPYCHSGAHCHSAQCTPCIHSQQSAALNIAVFTLW